jgi:hypothetical protein
MQELVNILWVCEANLKRVFSPEGGNIWAPVYFGVGDTEDEARRATLRHCKENDIEWAFVDNDVSTGKLSEKIRFRKYVSV